MKMNVQTVKEIMKNSPTTVQCQTPLQEIVTKLAGAHQTHLPVVNQQNKLLGMVSQVDCHRALLISGYHCDQPVKVNDIMAKSYLALSLDEKISEVVIKTQQETADTFPVVEEGKLIGIVSRVDLLTVLNENLLLCTTKV